MGDGIYTALSGAVAQQQALDVTANNVANASTAGFRADRAIFGELLAGAQRALPADAQRPAPPRVDKFVRVEQTAIDLQSGALRRTDQPLDLALQGDGFFVVRTPAGDKLTRAGNFVRGADGAITTVQGHPVIGNSDAPLVLPAHARDIAVGPDGALRADGVDVGTLKLVRPEDMGALTKEGNTLFDVAPGTPLVAAKGTTVVQGHLEASNVNAVAGINDLISVNRCFDAIHRVIETFQKIDERAARDLASR